MTIPCPVSTPCENPANPRTNFSSEAPDKRVFLGFSSNSTPPNPGQPFTNPTGYFYCEDGTSVEDAALCANNGAVDNGSNSGGTSSDPPPNTATDPGQGNQVFWNDEQHATVACPDGGSFTYTMRAGTVRGVSPQYANIVAQSLATQRAALYLICISSISPNACLDEDYDQIITASTRTVGEIDWQIKSGMLPPGLEILPDLFESKRISIAGTPTTAGNYTFVLRATDEKLNFTERTFTIMVLGITNSPPAGVAGTLYAFQFTAAGGTAPYTFSIPPGHLPAGLTSNESGRIAGTPTEAGDTTFTVTIEDDNGNICLFQETISVTAVTVLRLRISGYSDGLFTTGSGTGNLAPAWDGKFPLLGLFPGPGFYLLQVDSSWSVPGDLGGGRSHVGDFFGAFIKSGNNAGPFNGFFIIRVTFTYGTGPGYIIWSGHGPADPGWDGVSPPNLADAVGVYTRYNDGPSNLLSPSSLSLELYNA